MRDKIITFLGLASLLVIMLMLNFTDPISIGPLGVLVFFTMIFLAFFAFCIATRKVINKILHKNARLSTKEYEKSIIVAFAPILFLLMITFGMKWYLSVLLVAFFVFFGSFLVNKRFQK